MPTIIHGNDAYTGVEMQDESAWGTGTGSWIGVPVIRETLRTVFDPVGVSPEFGAVGAEKTVDLINPRSEGEITVAPRLDAAWFHWLLGQMFGEEKRVDGKYVDDSGGGTLLGSTHWYLPNNVFRSCSFRVWKSGPNSSGKWSVYTGMICNQVRIEWPPDGLMSMTFGFVGKPETTAAVSGSPGAPTGTNTPEARWLSQNSAAFQTGATLANQNIRGFTITYDRKIATDPSFLNDLSTANTPGPQGNRGITCTIQGLLTQDFADSGLPFNEFLNKVASKARIKIRDSEVASDSTYYYAMDLDFPQVKWLDNDSSVKEGGSNPTGTTFQAIEGTPVTPAASALDMRIGIYVNDTDDGSDHFTVDAGNVVQS